MSLHTYAIDAEETFQNKKVDVEQFESEIRASSITVALDSVTVSQGACVVAFKDDLSEAEVLLLESVVFAHTGEGLPKGAQLVELNTPRTSDGKLIFLPNLFPGNVTLYLCGAGDGETRGEGQQFVIGSDAAGESLVEFSFNDSIYFAGGTISWKGGELGDSISLLAYAPATPVVVNANGQGNCNVVNGMIAPALNGSHDVNLSEAVPVPAFNDEGVKTGLWSWDDPWTGLGTVTEATEPGNCHLIAVEVPLARFAAKLPLLGDGSMNLQLPAIKPKLMWPQWRFKAVLTNSGHAGLKCAWMIVAARYATL